MITLDEYLEEEDKLSRVRNLFETGEGTLSYFPEWGVDKTIISRQLPIQAESIQSYLRQKAFTNGIILSGDDSTIENFTETMTFKVGDN